jgi:thiol-disulfide isomerase/thioredoxin
VAYIVAAVVLIGLVSLLNLALTYGVIRRLRQHNDLLGAHSFAGPAPVSRLSVGAVVDDFKVVTVSGGTATRDELAGRTLVGFFSPDCPACAAEIGRFVEVARSRSRDSVWAVAVGDPDRVASTVATLTPVAGTVIAEVDQQEMVSAFGVAGFPAFFVMGEGGAVQAIGIRTDEALAKISA